jgi:hypothetical protein
MVITPMFKEVKVGRMMLRRSRKGDDESRVPSSCKIRYRCGEIYISGYKATRLQGRY